ncbi:hypothetical protein [Flavobacterium sp. 7A]|uniref:hypothetical protein n=1 Tax=Flavobacterium sp. 7A TaxID=2940571 RepID=UPI0022277B95|nr:hypothetical protein [Flavobacterium sp. 7A]MCW2120717.1 hypothetical protein [Flavobacterium sp. 7A]
MKLFFATLLSLMLLLPSLGSIVIYTQFKLAQDQIAKTICVQRANINNSCNGRCELQKNLKKYDDNEKRMNTSNLKEKSELVYTNIPFEFRIYTTTIPSSKTDNFTHLYAKPKMVIADIFRPPLV